jgi:hypothetical protein
LTDFKAIVRLDLKCACQRRQIVNSTCVNFLTCSMILAKQTGCLAPG